MPFVSLFCHKFVIRKFILPFLSSVMETDSSRRLKLRTSVSNENLKKTISYLNLLPLYEKFVRVSTLILFYITVAEVPAIFTYAETRIKGAQIGDHEIKQ